MIPVYKPYLTKENIKYAHDAIDSTWISSKGEFILKIEEFLSRFYNIGDARINSALTTSNGTTALHLIARLLKEKYPKINKIITPNNCYVAAWNAFLFDKNYQLQTVDADLDTWNINIELLYDLLSKSDLETTALLLVHNLGNIINVPQILRDWPGLVIIEDNCEGLMGKYGSYQSGSLSFASAISFFGNKNITSGEGGAIITSNNHQGYLYKLRSQGQSDIRFVHDELGYNYRMTNIQAALLYGQLENYNYIQQRKNDVFYLYKYLLKDVDGIEFQCIDKNTTHSNWMFGVRLKKNKNFSNIENFFKSQYIEVRPMFYSIDSHKHLQNIDSFGGVQIAKQLNNECVILPSYPELKDHEIQHIVNTLILYINKR
jgi:perosamine synthetase